MHFDILLVLDMMSDLQKKLKSEYFCMMLSNSGSYVIQLWSLFKPSVLINSSDTSMAGEVGTLSKYCQVEIQLQVPHWAFVHTQGWAFSLLLGEWVGWLPWWSQLVLWKPFYHLMGMKVPAPWLAFSDLFWMSGVGVPHCSLEKLEVCAPHLVLLVERGILFVLSHYARIHWLFKNVSCLEVAFCWNFSFLSVSIGISGYQLL